MERMLWLTVDYLRRACSSASRSRCSRRCSTGRRTCTSSLEQARSVALVARLALADDDVERRRRLVRAAKMQIDLAARHVGQEAVQLHGGIGMTMEYPVGHYLKRTTVIAKTFADTDTLIEQVGEGGGLIAAG